MAFSQYLVTMFNINAELMPKKSAEALLKKLFIIAVNFLLEVRYFSLTLDIDYGLRCLVCRFNGFCTGLEISLSNN